MNDAQITAHLRTAADVLVEMSEEIEKLGANLCCDPAVIIGHMAALQAIDLVAQKQRSLAALLRADCPVSAVSNFGVDSLRERFRASN